MLHNFVAKKDAHADKLIMNHSLSCAKDSLDFDADLNPKSTLKKKPDLDPAANLNHEHYFKIY